MDWFVTYEGNFCVERATAAGLDLSLIYIGGNGWSWQIRRDGVEVGQGVAGTVYEARAEVEAIALGLADDTEGAALRAGDARRRASYEVDFALPDSEVKPASPS